ncbi:MAG: ABC-type polysaccharide/polyol phosphate export system, permease component [Candidatus Shapirobacteria bacterium GW2011_GWE1_38_10]|uniref:Transport permease protein n=1 Tax=Candidatus Shapirobacteria bacterium GW2011_GWE1_38_10 TaxID=1618488 RepID=A0A0G0KH60_9BACT|nr:MAG: ABC-type polysaccharide/polyol phosphate export system, permease component [Candidatus Shapirobacteria bacterium GW2011_GWF2_37_20]KKQ48529.1 MAG: ABC-type polysaccharide/polyol phosphate export system, permease component [Candidatus Shapirobacteria bacterium GW2011_GWE1_38_10]KKQ64567.1 MAG: ABC-type polysaccharide/polyol phosphate export system, permease component [Candidatus Shapirobacteria bacterium GW2011_GWF1_38_23]
MLPLIKEIKDVIKWRELLWQMVGREVKARYKQSILGYFWVILNPLAQMLVMSFAFSIILRIPTNAASNIPYSIFLFVALLPWNLFATSLSSAASSLVNSSSLITKVYFPRTILVLSTIIAKIIDFLFASTILIVYMFAYHIPISLNILWIFPIFFIQQIFTLGLSLFFAAANLIYRDIQYLLNMIILLWLYASPVFYPVDLVPEKFKIIYQLNPMAVIINAYRQTILGSGAPNYTSLAIALVLSLVVLLLGLSYFKSREKIFADNI